MQLSTRATATLRALAKGPMQHNQLPKRTVASLLDKGLIEARRPDQVGITAEGLEHLGIEDVPGTESEDATGSPPTPAPKPNTKSTANGTPDFAAMREQIKARYEEDLACVDRVEEIHVALAAEA